MTGNLSFRTPKRERLADQLYGQLMESIVRGSFQKGEKLPSEKKISDLYKVSRPVVREALLRLQADGIIISRQGSGSYIQRIPPAGLMRFASASDISNLLKSYEVRVALECETCAIAAIRRENEDLAVMVSCLSRLEKAFAERCVDPEADFNFHMAIAKATGNEMFEKMLESIHVDIDIAMSTALHITSTSSEERAARVLSEHRMVYEAIERGDAEEARLAMRQHINRVRQRVTDNLKDL